MNKEEKEIEENRQTEINDLRASHKEELDKLESKFDSRIIELSNKTSDLNDCLRNKDRRLKKVEGTLVSVHLGVMHRWHGRSYRLVDCYIGACP